MPRIRSFSLPGAALAVAAAAMAASAALAYERVSKASDVLAMTADETADPGIDMMITGPVGPSKAKLLHELKASNDDGAKPVRRRMHLK